MSFDPVQSDRVERVLRDEVIASRRSQRRGAVRVTAALVGTALVAGGLGAAGVALASAATSQQAESHEKPTLFTFEPTGFMLEARTNGILGVNAQGCFVLDDALLAVASGSTVLADGKSIEIEGVGRYSVGERVEGSGGSYEVNRMDIIPSAVAECGTEEVVSVQ
jgi:hypothetical protein